MRPAGPREAVPVHHVAIALVELPKGGGVAGFRGAHQRGVGVRPSREDSFAETGSPEDLWTPGHLAK